MTNHEATAKRLLPCFNRKTDNHACCNPISHDHHCPSYYIPAVAAALAERDGLQEQFDAAYRDAVYFRKRCEELENPMECGHYAANLQPDDANADICVVCAEIAMVKAEATAKAGKP